MSGPIVSRPTSPADLTRDHLANERTYLAWVRTSMALMGLGFILARLGLSHEASPPVGIPSVGQRSVEGGEFVVSGLAFLVAGMLLTVWSGRHYLRTMRAITEGCFRPSRGLAAVLTSCVVVGGLVVIGLIAWRMVSPPGF